MYPREYRKLLPSRVKKIVETEAADLLGMIKVFNPELEEQEKFAWETLFKCAKVDFSLIPKGIPYYQITEELLSSRFPEDVAAKLLTAHGDINFTLTYETEEPSFLSEESSTLMKKLGLIKHERKRTETYCKVSKRKIIVEKILPSLTGVFGYSYQPRLPYPDDIKLTREFKRYLDNRILEKTTFTLPETDKEFCLLEDGLILIGGLVAKNNTHVRLDPLEIRVNKDAWEQLQFSAFKEKVDSHFQEFLEETFYVYRDVEPYGIGFFDEAALTNQAYWDRYRESVVENPTTEVENYFSWLITAGRLVKIKKWILEDDPCIEEIWEVNRNGEKIEATPEFIKLHLKQGSICQNCQCRIHHAWEELCGNYRQIYEKPAHGIRRASHGYDTELDMSCTYYFEDLLPPFVLCEACIILEVHRGKILYIPNY